MGPYNLVEPLARLIDQPEKGREFTIEVGQTIAYVMVVSKGITPLVQISTFNEDIWEWRQQSTELNTWEGFRTFSTYHIYNRG